MSGYKDDMLSHFKGTRDHDNSYDIGEDFKNNFLICAGCILFINLMFNIWDDAIKDLLYYNNPEISKEASNNPEEISNNPEISKETSNNPEISKEASNNPEISKEASNNPEETSNNPDDSYEILE